MEHPLKKEEPRTGFLDLPPELRNRRYEIALHIDMVRPRMLHLDNRNVNFCPSWILGAIRTGARVLSANRRLHMEVTPIFYGSFVFNFFHPVRADSWTREIGSSIVHVRHFSILIRFAETGGLLHHSQHLVLFLASISQCHNLKSLQIRGQGFWPGHTGASRAANVISKLLRPLCVKIVKAAREKDPRCDAAGTLEFLHLERLYNDKVATEILERLKIMLRTPEEVEEHETLRAVQRMFNPQDDDMDMLP